MLTACCVALLQVLLASEPDSLWYERSIERDLTGDGRAESLHLEVRGDHLDSLAVTFQIKTDSVPRASFLALLVSVQLLEVLWAVLN